MLDSLHYLQVHPLRHPIEIGETYNRREFLQSRQANIIHERSRPHRAVRDLLFNK